MMRFIFLGMMILAAIVVPAITAGLYIAVDRTASILPEDVKGWRQRPVRAMRKSALKPFYGMLAIELALTFFMPTSGIGILLWLGAIVLLCVEAVLMFMTYESGYSTMPGAYLWDRLRNLKGIPLIVLVLIHGLFGWQAMLALTAITS